MVPCQSHAAAAPGVCSGRCGKRFFDDVVLVGKVVEQTKQAFYETFTRTALREEALNTADFLKQINSRKG